MIRTLLIDLDKKEIKNELIEEKTLNYSIKLHTDIYKTYEKEPYENNLTIFSLGYIKDRENINSLIIYRSPITNSLDISLSSFGKYIKLTGDDLIILKGRADKKYFLIIENDNVIFLEDEIQEDIFKKKEELYNTLKDIYSGKDFIILLEGLGSKYTIYGNLIIFEGDKIKATKGGIGSILYNYHNITGLSIGGDNKIEIKKLEFGEEEKYHESIRDVYELIPEKIPLLNYRNIYLSEEENKKLFNDYIDPLIRNLKKDYPYEPFNMLGPFIGIFDEKLISDLIYTSNKYGLDTLYLGYILGLIFEGINLGKVNIKDIEKPSLDINNISSEKNYNIAKYIIEKISYEELSILGKNIRYISNLFNLNDISFYIPLGDNYSSIINPYLSLGLFLPNIIYDKYFSDYLMNVFNPEEYAKFNFGRFESTYEINNVSNEFSIEKEIKRENIFSKMFEYKKLANSSPNKNYPKRVIDIYNYLARKYNINYNFDQYFDEYYKKYLEEIYNRAPVV
ncbi:MAG: aldehyde ferredoxin oxidoreductase N-terminal domain-containing protein [Nanopusillaceae archaeon]